MQVRTLNELQQITQAYNKYSEVSNASIPPYYKELFPKVCKCGANIILTEPEHTQLQCCNPTCWLKMSYRLSYFLNYLGFKGFGDESCYSLFESAHDLIPYASFLSVFHLTDTQVIQSIGAQYGEVLLNMRSELKANTYPFTTAIAALGIPNIGPKSRLFDVVKDPVTLMSMTLNNQTEQLADLCQIQAPMTRFYLSQSAPDILFLMRDVMPNIAATPQHTIHLAITGTVTVNNTPYSRPEFIQLCNNLKNKSGEQAYQFVETKAASKLQYVIADHPSSTPKYQLGAKLNNLITADAFYKLLLTSDEVTSDTNEQ